MNHATSTLRPTDIPAELAETRGFIHEVCRDWAAGTLTLAAVRSTTTGLERWNAYRVTDQAGPMWSPMTRLFDVLVATDPTSEHGYHYATNQGVFSEAELRAANARYTKLNDGRVRITFPGPATQEAA